MDFILTGLRKTALGDAFDGGNVIPFARGGVVDRPTLLPMARGAGLMGEAGPEGVLPLTPHSVRRPRRRRVRRRARRSPSMSSTDAGAKVDDRGEPKDNDGGLGST